MGYNSMKGWYCDWCGKVVFSPSTPYPLGMIDNRFCSNRCRDAYKKSRPSSNGCFITTATCKSKNLPDNCYELTTLRTFRDNYMKKNVEMEKEVSEYYEIAPKICTKIDSLENSSEIYNLIWSNYLVHAIKAIEEKNNDKAHNIYKDMVLKLKDLYLK